MKARLTAVIALAWSLPGSAQWLNHSTPGIPRNADGLRSRHRRNHDCRSRRLLAEGDDSAAAIVEIHISGNARQR
jgi:hypothetical protein